MRRGTMKIEKHAFELPTGPRQWQLDPAVTRDGDRVLLDGEEIDRRTTALYGLAIDLGTTTVVMRLLNLETGEVVADSSFENPQRFGGSDVMARIVYDTEDRTKTLQRTLVGYMSRAILEFPVDPRSIYEVIIAGNSTMRDMFFRLSVYSIGQSPYQSLTELELAEGKRGTTSLADTARRIGLPHPPEGTRVRPADHQRPRRRRRGGLHARDRYRKRGAHGRGHGHRHQYGAHRRQQAQGPRRVVSCRPGLRGRTNHLGMPGLPGAIEKVRIDDDGSVQTTVIGDVPAEGICGSGLVDLLAELLRTGRMNQLGRFEEAGQDFVVAGAGTERPVTFSEADINALAQAKGANVAGLQIAFAEYGISYAQLDRFYLAGGFGRHLSLDSSKRIGLIPDLDTARIVQVGNASVEGACIALLSRTKRAELEALVKRVVHCRLETHPGFFDYFVRGLPVRAGRR